MFRLFIPAAVALLLASATPARAQYPGSAMPPGLATFNWYGVPNGQLHRTLGNGVSYYPYYNFGGYQSIYRMPAYQPSYVAPYSNNTPLFQGSGWRRGWRR